MNGDDTSSILGAPYFQTNQFLAHYPNLVYLSHIRGQDRGPLFPGSSCFPLSPDHKHKRGKLRTISRSGDGSPPVAKWDRNMGMKWDKHPDPCLCWGTRGWVPHGLDLDHTGSHVIPCLRSKPRTDYRYHTRGKHDQLPTQTGESGRCILFLANMPGTSLMKMARLNMIFNLLGTPTEAE